MNTTGFRADFANILSRNVNGNGLPTRVFTETTGTWSSNESGAMISTSRDLDVAVQGEGWIAVVDGNGDKTRQTEFTGQSLTNMLRQLGIQLPENADPNLRNVAAVSVTATLPPFARPGQND